MADSTPLEQIEPGAVITIEPAEVSGLSDREVLDLIARNVTSIHRAEQAHYESRGNADHARAVLVKSLSAGAYRRKTLFHMRVVSTVAVIWLMLTILGVFWFAAAVTTSDDGRTVVIEPAITLVD